MFTKCFKEVTMKCKGCFKDVSKDFYGSLRTVSRVFKKDSMEFQGRLQGVPKGILQGVPKY